MVRLAGRTQIDVIIIIIGNRGESGPFYAWPNYMKITTSSIDFHISLKAMKAIAFIKDYVQERLENPSIPSPKEPPFIHYEFGHLSNCW